MRRLSLLGVSLRASNDHSFASYPFLSQTGCSHGRIPVLITALVFCLPLASCDEYSHTVRDGYLLLK